MMGMLQPVPLRSAVGRALFHTGEWKAQSPWGEKREGWVGRRVVFRPGV